METAVVREKQRQLELRRVVCCCHRTARPQHPHQLNRRSSLLLCGEQCPRAHSGLRSRLQLTSIRLLLCCPPVPMLSRFSVVALAACAALCSIVAHAADTTDVSTHALTVDRSALPDALARFRCIQLTRC